jgi:hypothetical protein
VSSVHALAISSSSSAVTTARKVAAGTGTSPVIRTGPNRPGRSSASSSNTSPSSVV